MADAEMITRPKPGVWELEPAHTSVSFIGRHLGLARVRGRFADSAARIEVADDLDLSTAEFWVEAASVDTGNTMRDNHLRSPDFMNVENYPQIHFVSTKVERTGDGPWDVTGDLTIRDVTRPTTFEVELAGVIDDEMYQTQRAGFSARAEINKDDFAMTWNMPLGLGGLVANKVVVEIDAEILLTPYVTPQFPSDEAE
ncbi:MAG: YceI family protein [Acidimicrobiia bacterium]